MTPAEIAGTIISSTATLLLGLYTAKKSTETATKTTSTQKDATVEVARIEAGTSTENRLWDEVAQLQTLLAACNKELLECKEAASSSKAELLLEQGDHAHDLEKWEDQKSDYLHEIRSLETRLAGVQWLESGKLTAKAIQDLMDRLAANERKAADDLQIEALMGPGGGPIEGEQLAQGDGEDEAGSLL